MQLYMGPGRLVIASYADELRHLPLRGRPTWLATLIASAAITVMLGVIVGAIAYLEWAGAQAGDAVLVALVAAIWVLALRDRRGCRR